MGDYFSSDEMASFYSIPVSKKIATESAWFEEARKKELENFRKFNVYERVHEQKAEKNRKTIDMRYHGVEKVKDEYVVYERKVRLVARGDQLNKQTDVGKTFGPTPSAPAVRYFYAHTVAENLFNRQSDLTTAYLNAKYKSQGTRPIYFRPPPGADQPGILWKPKVAVYGMPDALNLFWYDVMVPFVISQGFEEHPYGSAHFTANAQKRRKQKF
eukprot:gb/GEZN01007507.1/.p1 GENE.gb/GEZN01007507.1/~~gb/GEZN01007507.1/.p1  ORF type:complete len:214 (-),score=27.35 gb/GEZN01007507.1/:192-833(-)